MYKRCLIMTKYMNNELTFEVERRDIMDMECKLIVESQTPPGSSSFAGNWYYAKFQYGQSFLRGGSCIAHSWKGRGMNVVIYDPITLKPEKGIRAFDTWGEHFVEEGKKFKDYIDDIPEGAIVAIAVCDSAVRSDQKILDTVTKACESLGSTEIDNVSYRVPWAMIATKGGTKITEKIGTLKDVSVTIEADLSPKTSEELIGTLKETAPNIQIEGGQTLKEAIVTSLIGAKGSASPSGDNPLNTDLYNALEYLNGKPVGWPESFEGYLDYLTEFAKWLPRQSTDKAWLEPGTPGTEEYQVVYDHLCHFYYLIDQTKSPAEKVVQSSEWFSKWLVKYAKAWGSYLNTTASFNSEILRSFIEDSPKYQVKDSMVDGMPNNPSGWLTFNQFFARELNPGLRPIDNPDDNTVVVSPADCTYRNQFSIDKDSRVKIKGTHTYSVETLFEGSKYKDDFANGLFVHFFLGPYSYHRFHTPVAGKVVECYPIQGLVYLDVNIKEGQFDAPDSSTGGYEFAQARGVIIIDTKDSPYGNVGVVAVIPVGMCQVSSVNMIATVGANSLKGDEFGYFLFGGSDIILLFQEQANPQVVQSIPEKHEPENKREYLHYGKKVVTLSTIT